MLLRQHWAVVCGAATGTLQATVGDHDERRWGKDAQCSCLEMMRDLRQRTSSKFPP